MQIASDAEDHRGPRSMSMSDGMAGAGDIGGVAGHEGVPRALPYACVSILVLPQTSPFGCGTPLPGMCHDWLLDVEQIMNHPQVSIIISNQDEDLVKDVMDWKVSEGDSHSSTLAWKIPWMEDLVRLQSMGSGRVRHY